MDPRDEDTRSPSVSSLKLRTLTRDAWIPFSTLITALFGIKLCRIPIRVARADVVVGTYPGSADLAAALVRYDDDNQKIFDLLTLAMALCAEGRAVMNEFGYNPALADVANPAKYADDGRNAFLRLERNAMGGGGVNTAAYALLPLSHLSLTEHEHWDR